MTQILDDHMHLILAAEDCDPSEFQRIHKFTSNDEKLIRKLMAHGPVLLRGGRGCGKSALMIEASRRLSTGTQASSFGIYISLRHLELLRYRQKDYERYFCNLVAKHLGKNIDNALYEREIASISELQEMISRIVDAYGKRIVLFFDDAAHIGREASLEDFFDIFRTISSNVVSCKAAIYPGVTKFGTRFDVLSDATVIDVSRNEELPGFADFFVEVLDARYPGRFHNHFSSTGIPKNDFAGILGKSVLGNMRSFVIACNLMLDSIRSNDKIGLNELADVMVKMASNHYWPMLEELRPKLGMYEPVIKPAQEVAEIIFSKCAEKSNRFALIHRDITEKISKPLEILEYAGFILKRESSRAMKSGGRGVRYAINLCNLFEKVPGARMTRHLYQQWSTERPDPIEFHRGSQLIDIEMPPIDPDADLGIFKMDIESIKKSNAYPYGLTDNMISLLRNAGFATVGKLADAEDNVLDQVPQIGDARIQRIRNVIGQAVWM